jgi:glycine/D-amino acid oxidase-like deaminating enzyme
VIERCLWDETARVPTWASGTLPARADVVIVGGGYTGLAAARALARRATEVAVLEQHTIGWGASSRNGGFVLPGFKVDVELLARSLGLAEARRLFALSLEAVRRLESVIDAEAIDCAYARVGTVALAARPGHLRGLERSRRFLHEALAHQTELLGPAEVRDEIGSGRYHGGLLDRCAGSVQPAALVWGLASAAARAGARLVERAPVVHIHRHGRGFAVVTTAGTVEAREVLVATNGYTGVAVPALRRRVVPVGSYLIATAPLAPAAARRLIPRGRVLSDTKNLLYYFRLSPDHRLVFGGRAAFTPTAVAESARILARGMVEVFPELAGTRVDYAWGGQVAFALDQMPHAGRLDGLHYALGYGGHGVAMATWLGERMGEAMAGAAEIPRLTAPFRPVPFYTGTPWFLPLVGAYYRVRDRLG